jgi:hypothetical protein
MYSPFIRQFIRCQTWCQGIRSSRWGLNSVLRHYRSTSRCADDLLVQSKFLPGDMVEVCILTVANHPRRIAEASAVCLEEILPRSTGEIHAYIPIWVLDV